MAVTADFPDDLMVYTNWEQQDGVDDAEADDINKTYKEIVAIETELGINPRNNFASVSKAVVYKVASTAARDALTWEEGQLCYTTTDNKLWKCTVAGSPGTWVQIVSSGESGDYDHASTHLPTSGGDAIDTGTPHGIILPTSPNLSKASAITFGNADSFAQSDHVHGMGVYSSISQVGNSSSLGVATSFCRGDHVHQKHDDTPSADEKDALDSASQGCGTPSASNVYTTQSYVDGEVSSAAGLCLVAGNETVVSGVTATSKNVVKEHRITYTNTVLAYTTVYVAAEIRATIGGTTTLEIYIDNVLRSDLTLQTTQTNYTLYAESWTHGGALTDGNTYSVDVSLRTNNASFPASMRLYEFYIR